jgi:hypothetical protein
MPAENLANFFLEEIRGVTANPEAAEELQSSRNQVNEVPRMLVATIFGQVAEDQQPPAAAPALDSEYRKFDEVLSVLRTCIARQYAIDSAKGVDEAMYVYLGGTDQWIIIRGEDRQNPVLLFVHGGPGDVTNPWSFAYFAAWESASL